MKLNTDYTPFLTDETQGHSCHVDCSSCTKATESACPVSSVTPLSGLTHPEKSAGKSRFTVNGWVVRVNCVKSMRAKNADNHGAMSGSALSTRVLGKRLAVASVPIAPPNTRTRSGSTRAM